MLDISVIQCAAKGKKEAEREIFEHFYPYVMSITLRYMKNEEEAEELLNDAFLKAFSSLNKFNIGLDFKPWLRRITVNTCIDALRKKKKDQLHLSLIGVEELAGMEENFDIPGEVPLLPMIRELPTAYRTVFNLYVFEDYKHREIAEMLGISEGTSKSNYARAKNLIRKQIDNEMQTMKKILFNENRMG